MKHLTEYISEVVKEQTVVESECSKSITFNFSKLDNAEDTLKSLEGKEGCTVDTEENKLTVKVCSDNVDKLSTVQDILQQFVDAAKRSSEFTNNESYAQKVSKFGSKVEELNTAIDEIQNSSEEDEDKSDDDSNEDKSDDDSNEE